MKVKAKITLIPTEKGGREKPIDVVFKPSFCVGRVLEDCHVALMGKKQLRPGETADAEIVIKGKPALKKEMEFSLLEGVRKVATGKIDRIIA